jgi:hypothetical protein
VTRCLSPAQTKSIMSESVIRILEDLGFEILQNLRLVIAQKMTEGSNCLSVYVDVQENIFDLEYSQGFFQNCAIKRQHFSDSADLKATLLKNQIFTHYSGIE